MVLNLYTLLNNKDAKSISYLFSQYHSCKDLIRKLDSHINNNAPVILSKGNTIKDGVNKELDNYREITTSSELLFKL